MAQRKRTLTPQPPPFIYDPHAYDDVISGMFGRRWDETEPEVLPTFARSVWSCLFRASALQDSPDLQDAEMLLSIFENTQSSALKSKAKGGLRMCLLDCSGTLDALKPTIKALLDQSDNAQTLSSEFHYAHS